MKIEEGTVFAIKTKKGFGFLQCVGLDQFDIEIIRVLEPIKKTNELTQVEVDIPERYTVHFVAKAALRKKLIERIGVFHIPKNYQIPTKARSKHIVRGEFLGWHIIDQSTLKRETKQDLTSEDMKLPFHGHPNDSLLREYLENDWRLENWK